MSVKKTDISQIKKYLAGELDAKAMHQLERRAQDDPFLQDALDGFEAKGFDQPGLDALNTRLQECVNQKEARVIPWRTLSIAASILIVIGLGGVWLANRNTERNKAEQQLDAVSKPVPEAAKQQVVVKPDSIPHEPATASQAAAPALAQVNPATIKAKQQPVVRAGKSTPAMGYNAAVGSGHLNEKSRPSPDTANAGLNEGFFSINQAKKDSSTKALTDMIVAGYGTKRRKDSTHLEVIGGDKATQYGYNANPKASDTTYLHNLTAKLKEVTIEQPGGAAGNAKPVHIVNGQILPANDTHLTRPNTTPMGYDMTDDDGNLARSSGYALAKNHRVKKSVKDSLSMEAVAASPVIYNESKKKYTIDTLNAHPIKGWKALTDYLNTNATSADGKTGLLKISFMVEASGLLDNFKIVYSLSAANDQKVVTLLRNGPAWAPNVSLKPETVTLTIRVH